MRVCVLSWMTGKIDRFSCNLFIRILSDSDNDGVSVCVCVYAFYFIITN